MKKIFFYTVTILIFLNIILNYNFSYNIIKNNNILRNFILLAELDDEEEIPTGKFYGEIYLPDNIDTFYIGDDIQLNIIINDPNKPIVYANHIKIIVNEHIIYDNTIPDDFFSLTYKLSYEDGYGSIPITLYSFNRNNSEYTFVQTINITIKNQLPTGNFISPNNSSIYSKNSTIPIKLNANDFDRTPSSKNKINIFISNIGSIYKNDIDLDYFEYNYKLPENIEYGNYYMILEVYDFLSNQYIETDRIYFKVIDALKFQNISHNIFGNYSDVNSSYSFEDDKLYFRIKLDGTLLNNEILEYGISNSENTPIYTHTINNISQFVYDINLVYPLVPLKTYYIHAKLTSQGKITSIVSTGIKLVSINPPEISAKKYKNSPDNIIENTWVSTDLNNKGNLYFTWTKHTVQSNEDYYYEYKINNNSFTSINTNEINIPVPEGKNKITVRTAISIGGYTKFSNEKTFDFYIDDTPPSISKFILDDRSSIGEVEKNIVENGKNIYYTNGTDTYLVLNINETLSGLNKVTYGGNTVSISDTTGSIIINENISNYLLSLNESNNLIIPLVISDNAGNEVIINDNLSNIFVLDKTPPSLIHLFIKDNDDVYRSLEPNTYYFNLDNSKLYIDVIDNLSGLKELYYLNTENNNKIPIVFSGEKNLIEIESDISNLNFNTNGEKNINITISDRAGNIATYTNSSTLFFDKDPPQFKYIVDENGDIIKDSNGDNFYIGYILINSSNISSELFPIKSGLSKEEPFNIYIPDNYTIKLIVNITDSHSGLYTLNDMSLDLMGVFNTHNRSIYWNNYNSGYNEKIDFNLKDKSGNINTIQLNNINITNKINFEFESYINNYNRKNIIKQYENIDNKGEFKKYELGEY